jgi:ComF family protein
MLYPRVCAVCHNWLVSGEEEICLHCLAELPKTHYGLQKHNPVEKLFWGRVPFAFAGAFLNFYHKGKAREILHQIKYKGAQPLAELMGRLYGEELTLCSDGLIADMIIPVPLHPRKQRQRGYNQSEAFANGLGELLKIPVRTDIVSRILYSQTQTKKARFNRWQNVDGIFRLEKPEDLENKRILIVDDVITTGATLEACLKSLNPQGLLKPGILSLAVAKN